MLAASHFLRAQQDPFRDHSRVPRMEELLTAFDFEPADDGTVTGKGLNCPGLPFIKRVKGIHAPDAGTRDGQRLDAFTLPQYEQIRRQARSLAEVIASSSPQRVVGRLRTPDLILPCVAPEFRL